MGFPEGQPLRPPGGGDVREAGVLLILLFPAAYVDVTSCWRFPSRWQRMHVSVAGMYAELFLAAAAAMKTDREADGAELLDRLARYQKDDGHLEATEGTITRSGGLSMQMETTALAERIRLETDGQQHRLGSRDRCL